MPMGYAILCAKYVIKNGPFKANKTYAHWKALSWSQQKKETQKRLFYSASTKAVGETS